MLLLLKPTIVEDAPAPEDLVLSTVTCDADTPLLVTCDSATPALVLCDSATLSAVDD